MGLQSGARYGPGMNIPPGTGMAGNRIGTGVGAAAMAGGYATAVGGRPMQSQQQQSSGAMGQGAFSPVGMQQQQQHAGLNRSATAPSAAATTSQIAPGSAGLQRQASAGGAGSGADILALLQKGGGTASSSSAAPPPGLAGPPGLGGRTAAQATASDSRSAAPSVSSAAGPIGLDADGGGGGSSGVDGYGMVGLLSLIRAPERDLQSLALGADLGNIGLQLSSSEPLHASFATPWAREPALPSLEPHFSLPSCYRLPQPALKTGHLSKFDDTTLLYIFYAMPRDVLQAYAAQELYAREWRYHKDLRTWFKGVKAGVSIAWTYFDIQSWEKRAFNGNPQQAASLPAGFLTEEECRVKPVAAAGAVQ